MSREMSPLNPNYTKTYVDNHANLCRSTYLYQRWSTGTPSLSYNSILCHRQAESLRWRNNERDGVPDHLPNECLLNRLFRRRSKKTSKLRVTGLCARNSLVTGEFHVQTASNAGNVAIWWRHRVTQPLFTMRTNAVSQDLKYRCYKIRFKFWFFYRSEIWYTSRLQSCRLLFAKFDILLHCQIWYLARTYATTSKILRKENVW